MFTTHADMQQVEPRIAKAREAVQKGLADYKSLVSDDTDRKNYEAVAALAQKYFVVQERLIEISRKKEADPKQAEVARALLFGESRQLFQELSTRDGVLVELQRELGRRNDQGSRCQLSQLEHHLADPGPGRLLMVSALAGYFIARSITTADHHRGRACARGRFRRFAPAHDGAVEGTKSGNSSRRSMK